ncbi:hypothetical protein ACVQ8P_05465 [Dellaglioa sp. BT-FLS60]
MNLSKKVGEWILRFALLFMGCAYGYLIYTSMVINGHLVTLSTYFGGTLSDRFQVIMVVLQGILFVILGVMPTRYLQKFWKHYFISAVVILLLALSGMLGLLSILYIGQLMIVVGVEWLITLGFLFVVKGDIEAEG